MRPSAKQPVFLSHLDKSRILILHGPIESKLAYHTNIKLNELSIIAPTKPIHMHISSEGGDFWDMLSILETMEAIKAPVYTTVVGYCFSGAALLVAAGKRKHRFIRKNSWVMVHELSAEFTQQKMSDLEIEYEWTRSCNEQLLELLSYYTKRTLAALKKDLIKDHPLNAEEALEFGIVDRIV